MLASLLSQSPAAVAVRKKLLFEKYLKFQGEVDDLYKKAWNWIMSIVSIFALTFLLVTSCAKTRDKRSDDQANGNVASMDPNSGVSTAKLALSDCTDPDLAKVAKGETMTMCDGTIGEGTLQPDAAIIAEGHTFLGVVGTYSGSSGSSPDPWNVRYGVTVGTTTGKLKVNCRNLVDISTWDNTGGLAGAGDDIFDTIDDGSSGGTYPTTNPWSEDHFCGSDDPTYPNWVRVTTDPVTTGVNSVFEDKITGLKWTRGNLTVAKDWDEVAGGAGNGAIEYCDNLNHGGISAWRLPTQKELMAAYVNGIYDLDDDNTDTDDNLGNLMGYFWSSTTRYGDTSQAWLINFSSGNSSSDEKINAILVICVSP